MKFKRNTNFVIEPEEILLENSSGGAKRLEISLDRRYLIWGSVLSGMCLIFFAGLALKAQIFSYDGYFKRSQENSLRNIFVEAPRGLIIDRFGKVLADNKVSFEVRAVRENLGVLSEKLRQVSALSEVVGIESGEVLEKVDSGEEIIFRGLDSEMAIKFRAREGEFSGFKLIGLYERNYLLKEATSHLLGYIGLVTEEDKKNNSELSFDQNLGKIGIELLYDQQLRGRRGSLSYQVDVRDDLVGVEKSSFFNLGKTIQLTLDGDLQAKIYEVFERNVYDQGSGAVGIALEPKTGEVLAMVSYPGFDISRKIWSSSKAQPFFNRAISGEYSPGSTIKPFIALAALEDGIIDPYRKIDDTRGKLVIPNPYFPDKPSIFRDWKVHGWEDMASAIADSCNVYFYTIGGGFGEIKGLGAGKIKSYLEKYGWGEKTGIEFVNEKSGFLPDEDWKKKTLNDDWRVGDTYLYSIGQGYVKTTPIQLASNYQLFANRGKVYQPFLIKKIFDQETGEELQSGAPRVLREYQIESKSLGIINQGLERTVVDGSAAGRMADLPFSVSGKTGSIQTSSSLTDTNAAFVAFAPAEDPEILLLVLVESGGSGGATAVPLAKEILYWYWENRMDE